eukprot:SAG11_NODE_4905_length_1727_cov_1.548526_1_plen_394_part_10
MTLVTVNVARGTGMAEPRWGDVLSCLDVQPPWGDALLDGAKTVETREYRMPPEFEGTTLALLDHGGGGISGPALLIGTAVFGRSFRYESRKQWVADSARHLVPADAAAESFGWRDDAEKWGWPVETVQRACYPVAAPPMTRSMRSLFALQWPPAGRVFVRPDFRARLCSAQEALRLRPREDGVAASAASLLVLADFDRTLSAYAAPAVVGGSAMPVATAGQCPSAKGGDEVEVGEECHDIIFYHAELGAGFDRAVAPLLVAADADKEARTVQDMAALLNAGGAGSAGSAPLSFAHWEDYAGWWWGTAHSAMVEHGLTKAEIVRAVGKARVAMRGGAEELVKGCRERATPLVVVSAGITDVIDALMVAHVGAELWPTEAERHRTRLATAAAVPSA